ncbi:MAG: filamentous hemagglutinin N-terminal domain-containing protein [Phenylobacterium sp.]|nr:filamentous hemagglutinin N-terminal domain-containing protein [Phenylobacterium sp.]
MSAVSRIALTIALLAAPAAVQAQTAVTPDVGNPFALGTTAVQSGSTITIDGGARAGANLFHSFTRFNLGVGATARWTAADPGGVAHVINRVTGGETSRIDGTLDSTALPNAAFYFVNPAGIVFGAGAAVNVPGAAHFSTASHLAFADGGRFTVAAPDGSTLSVAAPEAWGFLGGQGDITVTGVGAEFAPVTSTLAFSASDITVSNATFGARGLDMTAVGDLATNVSLANPLTAALGGQLNLEGSRLSVQTTDVAGAPARLSGGEVRLASGNLVSDTAGVGRGGDLVLQGDRVVIAPDGIVISSARGAGAGGDILVTGGLIEVDARGATTTTGFGSASSSDGAAGGIALTADTIRLTGEIDNAAGAGNAFIGSNIIGAGSAGDVALDASLLVIDIALISTTSLGTGDGGDIRINATTQDLGAALVLTSSFGGGLPGDVRIDGETITISGGSFGAVPGASQESGSLVIAATRSLEAEGGGFQAVSASPTSSGNITLSAPLVFLSQSRIDTQAFNEGLAGQVLIEADSLLLDRVDLRSDAANGPLATGLVRLTSTGDLIMFQGAYSASVFGAADGGRIEIVGRDVQLLGAIVQTDATAFGSGDAGQISVTADTLTLDNAILSSSSGGDGRGGDVNLNARTVRIENSSLVLSESNFAGDAGSVSLVAETLDLEEANIFSRAVSGTGNAGAVRIDAGRLFMFDATVSSESRTSGRGGTVNIRADDIEMDGGGREFTGITSEALSLGDAGDVTIEARKSLKVKNDAYISSASFTEANAGNVDIRGGEISVLRGGNITSTGFRGGDSGDVSITVDKLLLQGEAGRTPFIASAADGGEGRAGDVVITVGTLVVDAGAISSDTFAAGDAGQLRITADNITLKNLGSISSSTNSLGDAGSVDVRAKTLLVEDRAVILSVATSVSNGNAGAVRIAADDVVVGQDAVITTATFGTGDAGGLDISAKTLRIDGGQVSSAAEGDATGRASRVSIVTDRLDVLNTGAITTLSVNPNQAGQIDITAGEVLVDGIGSVISSENQADGSGDAGSILLRADNVRLSNGGRITTNSVAGAAGDIEVRIDRPGLFVLEGAEAPGIIQTSSGAGTGGRIIISNPLAIISNGSRILALGELRGANVVIQSRYFVESTDRVNTVAVDGEFQIQTGLYDVSSGVVSRDLSVLDASRVLRGQCPAARSTGSVSQLITRPVGPYVREAAPESPRAPQVSAPAPGACP